MDQVLKNNGISSPDGTVIVRLSAVDAAGYTHFYDEMLVSQTVFERAMHLIASDQVHPVRPVRTPGAGVAYLGEAQEEWIDDAVPPEPLGD